MSDTLNANVMDKYEKYELVTLLCQMIYKKNPNLENFDADIQEGIEKGLGIWNSFVNDVQQGNDR